MAVKPGIRMSVYFSTLSLKDGVRYRNDRHGMSQSQALAVLEEFSVVVRHEIKRLRTILRGEEGE